MIVHLSFGLISKELCSLILESMLTRIVVDKGLGLLDADLQPGQEFAVLKVCLTHQRTLYSNPAI